VVWQKELADTQLQIVAFAVSHRGELLIADYAGGIYRLIRSPRQESPQEFPMSLSQTGLFPFNERSPRSARLDSLFGQCQGWADGAHVERFMALPDDSRIGN
jgi:hypothetical protein